MVDSNTPGVALPSFAVGPLGMAQGQFPQVEFGELIYMAGPLLLRVILGDVKNDP